MGTRSTYRVIEEWTDERDGVVTKGQNKLVLLYGQYDGYPEGHPMDTAQWLANGKVVNGFGIDTENQLVFNGGGCLAAQLVAKLKDGPGGYYIHPMNHRGHCWENYTYDIIVKEDRTIEYIAYEIGGSKRPSFKKIFQGSPEEFIKKYSEVEEEVE